MLKLSVQGASGKSIVILGLTAENVGRLQAGAPILFPFEEVGGEGGEVMIIAGEDTQHLVQQLRAYGIDMPDIPDAAPGQRIELRFDS